MSMTLILGARCTDGVVISGDTKIVDLATRDLIRYSTKLFGVLRNVIFGYAGSEDMFYIFLRCVIGDLIILRDAPDNYTHDNLFQKLSNIMHILMKIRKYQDFALQIMVARQFPNNGQSDLYLLNSLDNYELGGELLAKEN